MQGITINEIRLITGDARFMISLLNILNYDLVTTEDVIPPKKEKLHIYFLVGQYLKTNIN